MIINYYKMDNNDYYDPYVNYYQTPKKVTINDSDSASMSTSNTNNINNSNNGKFNKMNTQNPKKVFNPYQKEEIMNDVNNNNNGNIDNNGKEEMPEFVDLSKNAYSGRIKRHDMDDDGEIPLLEELGICPENIKQKLISVITYNKLDKQILEDTDMAGPFFVIVLFGVSLALVRL